MDISQRTRQKAEELVALQAPTIIPLIALLESMENIMSTKNKEQLIALIAEMVSGAPNEVIESISEKAQAVYDKSLPIRKAIARGKELYQVAIIDMLESNSGEPIESFEDLDAHEQKYWTILAARIRFDPTNVLSLPTESCEGCEECQPTKSEEKNTESNLPEGLPPELVNILRSVEAAGHKVIVKQLK